MDVHFSNLIDDNVKSCLYLNTAAPDKSVNKTHCETSELRKQLSSNTCQCKWNCEEVEYDISISQAKWPVQSAVRDFLDHFATSGHVKRIYKQLKLHYSNKTELQSSPSLNVQDIVLNGIRNENYRLLNQSVYDRFKSMKITPSLDGALTKANTLEDALVTWVDNSFYRLNIYFQLGTVEKHKQVPATSMVDLYSSMGGVLGLWVGSSVLSVIELVYLIVDICLLLQKSCGKNVKRAKVMSDD